MSEDDDADGSADFYFYYYLCMIAAFWRLSFSLSEKLRKKPAPSGGNVHGFCGCAGIATLGTADGVLDDVYPHEI